MHIHTLCVDLMLIDRDYNSGAGIARKVYAGQIRTQATRVKTLFSLPPTFILPTPPYFSLIERLSRNS